MGSSPKGDRQQRARWLQVAEFLDHLTRTSVQQGAAPVEAAATEGVPLPLESRPGGIAATLGSGAGKLAGAFQRAPPVRGALVPPAPVPLAPPHARIPGAGFPAAGGLPPGFPPAGPSRPSMDKARPSMDKKTRPGRPPVAPSATQAIGMLRETPSMVWERLDRGAPAAPAAAKPLATSMSSVWAQINAVRIAFQQHRPPGLRV